MSGNGQKIVTQRATLMRRRTAVQPKWETNVFALIAAARGTTRPGSFVQPLAREIPQAIETRLWGFELHERCHEISKTKANLLCVSRALVCSRRFRQFSARCRFQIN